MISPSSVAPSSPNVQSEWKKESSGNNKKRHLIKPNPREFFLFCGGDQASLEAFLINYSSM